VFEFDKLVFGTEHGLGLNIIRNMPDLGISECDGAVKENEFPRKAVESPVAGIQPEESIWHDRESKLP
jgi:hypothetical protein